MIRFMIREGAGKLNGVEWHAVGEKLLGEQLGFIA